MLKLIKFKILYNKKTIIFYENTFKYITKKYTFNFNFNFIIKFFLLFIFFYIKFLLIALFYFFYNHII